MRLKSIAEFAEFVGLHPATVRLRVERGELPVVQIGPTVRIDVDAFERQARRAGVRRPKQSPRGAVKRQQAAQSSA